MRATVIDDPGRLEELRVPWERLAIASRLPYCLPAWALAWWRHAAPAGAALRAVVVFDDDELAGLAPFFIDPRERPAVYRLLGSPICARVEPLARRDKEPEVAAAIAESLGSTVPKPGAVALRRLVAGSAWPERLADRWPGRRPTLTRKPADRAPSVDLRERSADRWLPSLSPNLRSQIRRARRALSRHGARIVVAEPYEMEAQIAVFARLHLRRIAPRGRSDALLPGVEEMLCEACRELARGGRVRLWTVRVGEDTISSQLFVAAGGQVSFWLGAFDDDWSRCSPGLVALMAAIEDAIERGDSEIDLGPGVQEYKQRISDGVSPLESIELYPRGRGHARARARSAPAAARRALSRRLPDPVRARYRRLRGR
jgi:CelD/BcsL family acetyltransferase involved in cellulose biosynthesis